MQATDDDDEATGGSTAGLVEALPGSWSPADQARQQLVNWCRDHRLPIPPPAVVPSRSIPR
jgi:hypothetical protein